MKFILTFVLLTISTTSLAKSPFKEIFPKKLENGEGYLKKVEKIGKDMNAELALGEKIAKDASGKEHKKEGDASICVLKFLENIGQVFEHAFEKEAARSSPNLRAVIPIMKDFAPIFQVGKSLVKGMLRSKRNALDDYKPAIQKPNSSSEQKKEGLGALEKLIFCLAEELGDKGKDEDGSGSGDNEKKKAGKYMYLN